MGAVEVGKDLSAVDALPIEGVIGEDVGIVPIHLGGEEVVNVAALHYLRDRGAVAEGIGQPEAVGGVAEILPRETLTPEELTHHGFARGDVAVAFDPNAAVRLISALGDLLFDALKELGIIPANHIGVAGGALDEFILGVLLHKGELI